VVQEVAPPLCEGRYRLIGELGVGGMATVYRAYDSRLQVERAIKLLAPHLAARASIRKRFEVEASTMARLHHPNIVTVHDIGSDGNRCFIVMEMLEGGSLMGRIEKFGVLPPKMAAAITADMVEALAVAHDNGVVHRDIKPHNVLLSMDNKPKITDFGIASVQQEDRSMTKTGAVMGTWAYMAPEQRISAKSADARADLYSSSASLYALMTGKEPFDLYTSELHEEMFQDIPPVLAAIIKKGCSYKPDDRYQTAKEMTEALRAILDELPEDPEGTPPLALPKDETNPGYSGGTLSPASFPDVGEQFGEQAAAASASGATFDGSMWLAEDEAAPPPVMPAVGTQPQTTDVTGTLSPSPTIPEGKSGSSVVVILAVLLVAAGGLLYMNQMSADSQAPAVAQQGLTANDIKKLLAEDKSQSQSEMEALRAELEKAKQREADTAKKQRAAGDAAKKRRTDAAKKKTTTAAPAPAPAAAAPAKPVYKPAAAPAAAPAPAAPQAATGKGELRMNSLPWSNMTVDGKPAGRTGRPIELSAGRHTVVLTTSDSRRHEETLTVRANKTETRCWNFDLEAQCKR
jgi:serine/threonine protein kinase